ncbi:serine/threonine protein kinase [Georgenia satyanarayanai]|uniref:non-specific serine/threonine protein kinase n=1 Tax=Georgenia satyanarayanai TaxID=860221 RepID=A0A2Y9AL97_9MICO|nr:protein kinase [Georgenia satyanarayanai]PYF98968.1 serine/threonine-protein kinase [Georgenia satyanarayanai]SSA44816.1 serine/threonine protein kinase [Georgenia satyanarayanai]
MSPDRILGGRYVLSHVIGEGGMAVVHLARDICLERPVAVKVLRSDLARDPLHRYRFRREAQALARLDHPGIVTVHDVGQVDDDGHEAGGSGAPFIVMEYIAGQSLRGRLREHAPTLEEAVWYLTAVLATLEVSHRAGVVHRDIKPANVMVTPDGAIKVVDFGIAHLVGDPVETATQGFLGTADYLSPEQVQGKSTDARSDLYSAGCLLYELVTARPPFVGDHAVAVAYQHVHEAPPRASTYRPEIPPELDEVLLTALAKDPGCRFQSARSFEEALRSAARGLVGARGSADTDHRDGVVPLPSRRAHGDAVTAAELRPAAAGR